MFRVFINIIVVGVLLAFSSVGNAVAPNPTPAPVPALSAQPIPTTIEEGKQYDRFSRAILSNPIIQELISENPNKIQVIEFFSYGCFWCGRLQPIMHAWAEKKPTNVVFLRFPLIFHKEWEVLAKAFLTVQALGKNEALDTAFFEAIQKKGINLSDEKLLKEFIVKQGISEKKFFDLYHSFTINQELLKAKKLADAYQVTVSPLIIVNAPSGSYSVTAKMLGSEAAVPVVLDFLVSGAAKK